MPDITSTCGGFGNFFERRRPSPARKAAHRRAIAANVSAPVLSGGTSSGLVAPVGGFLDEALNFSKNVVGAVTQYKSDVAAQKIGLVQAQTAYERERAMIAAEQQRAADAAKMKARMPLYIGAGVLAVGAFLLLKRR